MMSGPIATDDVPPAPEPPDQAAARSSRWPPAV